MAFRAMILRMAEGLLSVMARAAEEPVLILLLGYLGGVRLHGELKLKMADPARILQSVPPVRKGDGREIR